MYSFSRTALHRTPPSISRACRQMHRPPESDCPRRSSLQGTPETTSPARDRSPQQSASSDPSANRVGIIQRESNNQVRFHTARVIHVITPSRHVRFASLFRHERPILLLCEVPFSIHDVLA